MDSHAHWEQIYRAKPDEALSWTQSSPEPSLGIITGLNLPLDAPLLDLGGGASLLVDALLDAGYTDITVLDLSESALARSRERLGSRASAVRWIAADVRDFVPTQPYALWHDRAVFHFFTDPEDRARYREALSRAVAPEGYALIATFAPTGPEQCSGLKVQRYDAAALAAELGDHWLLLQSREVLHTTPWGAPQAFTYALFQHHPV